MFYFENIQDKRILKSDLITKAEAFFTTRESFLLTKEKVQPQNVLKNRNIICDYLQIKESDFITPEQTHSANIQIVKEGCEYQNTDGLILAESNKAIYLNFADCTPLIFYDEIQNIGAISHAGWRGTAQKIASLTVEKMTNDFDCKTKDIKVLIGPAICEKCYNVGEDVYNQLKSTVKNSKGLFLQKEKEIFADLKNINKQQLIETGISLTNIDVCPYCTCCDNNLFFSYRKENGTQNRHNAVLKLFIR